MKKKQTRITLEHYQYGIHMHHFSLMHTHSALIRNACRHHANAIISLVFFFSLQIQQKSIYDAVNFLCILWLFLVFIFSCFMLCHSQYTFLSDLINFMLQNVRIKNSRTHTQTQTGDRCDGIGTYKPKYELKILYAECWMFIYWIWCAKLKIKRSYWWKIARKRWWRRRRDNDVIFDVNIILCVVRMRACVLLLNHNLTFKWVKLEID